MTAEEKNDISNKDLADLVFEIQKHANSIVVLSEDEVKYIREMIEDRKAVSRVWSRMKTFLLTFVAVLIAWGTLNESVKAFIKRVFVG